MFNPSLEFLVNTPVGEELQVEEPFSLPDGRQVQRRSKIVRHDRLNQVTDHELIYYITDAGGRTERVVHAFSLRNTFKFEMEHLLIRLGFTVENVFADFGRTPFGSTYPGERFSSRRRRRQCPSLGTPARRPSESKLLTTTQSGQTRSRSSATGCGH
jgi:hypothetical protein